MSRNKGGVGGPPRRFTLTQSVNQTGTPAAGLAYTITGDPNGFAALTPATGSLENQLLFTMKMLLAKTGDAPGVTIQAGAWVKAAGLPSTRLVLSPAVDYADLPDSAVAPVAFGFGAARVPFTDDMLFGLIATGGDAPLLIGQVAGSSLAYWAKREGGAWAAQPAGLFRIWLSVSTAAP